MSACEDEYNQKNDDYLKSFLPDVPSDSEYEAFLNKLKSDIVKKYGANACKWDGNLLASSVGSGPGYNLPDLATKAGFPWWAYAGIGIMLASVIVKGRK